MAEIWDCFFFNDELDLLEARLDELSDSVDRFVLVEGDRTFSGQPKPLFFEQNRRRFLKWDAQITHIVARLDPDSRWAWDRENEQRRVLGSYLHERASSDVLILIGDVDELPDKDAFSYLLRHRGAPVRLRMDHACYFANWILPKPWSNSTLAFRTDQFDAPMVRVQLGDTHKDWAGYQEMQLDQAGVHLSFLGGAESIRSKLAAYSHQEFNNERFMGAPHLERCVEYGVFYDGRDVVHRLRRHQLNPLLRRLSERSSSSSLFNFDAPPLSPLRTRAYCGYTWLRGRRRVPDRFLQLVDRHPSATVGAGSLAFWTLDAALRARRRLRPAAEWPRPVVDRWGAPWIPPVVLRWR